MKFLIMVFLLSNILLAGDKALEYSANNFGKELKFWSFKSPNCYGSTSSDINAVLVVTLVDDIVSSSRNYGTGVYYNNESSSSSNLFIEDVIYYDGIPCAPFWNMKASVSIGTEFDTHTRADPLNNDFNTENKNGIALRFKLLRIERVSICEDIPTVPSNTLVSGLNFKSNLDSFDECESMFNDSGDGLGFSFVNPSSTPDECPTGHCYFNTPSESPCNLPTVPNATTVNGFTFQNNYDTFELCESSFNNNGDGVGFSFITPNNCTAGHCYYNTSNNDNTDGNNNDDSNTDDTPDDTTDGTADTVNDISELIPYVDDLETINTNIISSINDNKSSVDNVASKVQDSNTILNNILNSIDNLSPNNNDDESSNDNTLDTEIENDLQALTNNDLSTNDTSLNTSMTSFTSDYTNILDDSFSTYADVFGFGGYGAKPNSISFDLLGRNYILFDISYLDGYLEHIRLLFSTFAYLFGIFIFFRSV